MSPARDAFNAVKPYRRPMYARVLRLKHVQPGSVLCALYFEGSVFVGVFLAIAELVPWWVAVLLPIVVAVMVKLNDVIAGAVSDPSQSVKSHGNGPLDANPLRDAGRRDHVDDRVENEALRRGRVERNQGLAANVETGSPQKSADGSVVPYQRTAGGLSKTGSQAHTECHSEERRDMTAARVPAEPGTVQRLARTGTAEPNGHPPADVSEMTEKPGGSGKPRTTADAAAGGAVPAEVGTGISAGIEDSGPPAPRDGSESPAEVIPGAREPGEHAGDHATAGDAGTRTTGWLRGAGGLDHTTEFSAIRPGPDGVPGLPDSSPPVSGAGTCAASEVSGSPHKEPRDGTESGARHDPAGRLDEDSP